MIIDTLENLKKYESILPFSKEILNYLGTTDLLSLEDGKFQVAGDSVYILIQEYLTKPESEKKWESHKKYIDIQIVLSGEEHMGYCPAHLLKISEPYNEVKDVIFYDNDSPEYSKLLIPQNYFAIFFPGDAHKPGYYILKEERVRKIVFKVLMK
jgi:YhcH/YjgK/YiaL family protein